MRVLALTSSFPRSRHDEQSIFVRRLYDALAQQTGIDLTVIAPRSFDGELRYPVRLLQSGSRLFTDRGLLGSIRRDPVALFQAPSVLRELCEIVRVERPDVVHANWSLCGAVARFTKDIPVVTTLRGSDIHILTSPLLRSVARWLLSPSISCTAVSASLAQRASQVLGRAVFTIENGVELAPPEPLSLPESFLLSIGTVSPVKNTVGLVRSFAPFARQHPKLSLVIAGRLNQAEYVAAVRAKAKELGISSQVILLGPLSPGQITTALKRARAYCSLSHAEGRPNAVMEAQAAGLRCLLSDIPAHRELVRATDVTLSLSGSISDSNLLTAFEQAAEPVSQQPSSESVLPPRDWSACARDYHRLFSMVASRRVAR